MTTTMTVPEGRRERVLKLWEAIAKWSDGAKSKPGKAVGELLRGKLAEIRVSKYLRSTALLGPFSSDPFMFYEQRHERSAEEVLTDTLELLDQVLAAREILREVLTDVASIEEAKKNAQSSEQVLKDAAEKERKLQHQVSILKVDLNTATMALTAYQKGSPGSGYIWCIRGRVVHIQAGELWYGTLCNTGLNYEEVAMSKSTRPSDKTLCVKCEKLHNAKTAESR